MEHLQSLRDLAEKTTSTLSDMPSGGGNPHRMEGVITKMVDLDAEIQTELARLLETERNIAVSIAKINNHEHQWVLELRYLQGRSWDEIVDIMHYSLRTVHRYHGEALRKISAYSQDWH